MQFMALVPPAMLARLDALRVVLWTSRAEVNRQALDGGGLTALEADHAEKLNHLHAIAERAGVESMDYFVKNLVAGRQRVPSLEELEKMNRSQLRAALRS